MHESGEQTAVLKLRQQRPEGKPKSRALPIVAAVLIVILLMFGTYRLGQRSGPSTGVGKEGAAPGSATLAVTIPSGVELDAAAAASIGLKTAVVEIRAIARTLKLTGAVQVPPDSRAF